jgi:hypothetical protein
MTLHKNFDPKSSHSTIIPGEIELPLKIRGVLSYLETRKPSGTGTIHL